jgi:hypothetical protein
MGYAHGVLVRAEAKAKMDGMWEDMESQIEKVLKKLPAWVQKLIAELGLTAALDATWDLVKHWVGNYFVEEMHGLADATGLSYLKLRNIHLIGSLTQGKCSMYGAWGDAIAEVTKATGTNLMQVRALDWDTSDAALMYPAIIVYHPESGNGHAFLNIGWAGWIGAVSGMSSMQLAISEIGIAYPGNDFGNESRHGYPFTFMLRDILQFDDSLGTALARVGGANRTCDLLFGVGSGKQSRFRGMAVSASVFNVYDDTNLEPLLNGSHPRIKDVVYWGMDWLCPTYDEVFAHQINTYYGNISAMNTIRYIMPILTSGDTHIAVYDLTNMQLWYAAARQPGVATGELQAFNRQYTHFNANQLFTEAAPTEDSVLNFQ